MQGSLRVCMEMLIHTHTLLIFALVDISLINSVDAGLSLTLNLKHQPPLKNERSH